MNLGDFGAALRELDPEGERDSFTFFGERFEMIADVPAIVDMRLAAGLNGDLPEDDAVSAMWLALSIALGDEQFDRFQRIALEQRAAMPSMLELTFKICSAASRRPTVRPSSSGGGPPSTSQSSSASPVLQALPGMTPVEAILGGSGESAVG